MLGNIYVVVVVIVKSKSKIVLGFSWFSNNSIQNCNLIFNKTLAKFPLTAKAWFIKKSDSMICWLLMFVHLLKFRLSYVQFPLVEEFSSLLKVDKIVHDFIGNREIDHPVHKVEAEKGDGKDNPAVLVDVAGLHPKKPFWRSLSRWWGSGRRWRGTSCNKSMNHGLTKKSFNKLQAGNK